MTIRHVLAFATIVAMAAPAFGADNRSHHDDSYTDPVNTSTDTYAGTNVRGSDGNTYQRFGFSAKEKANSGKNGTTKNTSRGKAAHNNQDCAGCN